MTLFSRLFYVRANKHVRSGITRVDNRYSRDFSPPTVSCLMNLLVPLSSSYSQALPSQLRSHSCLKACSVTIYLRFLLVNKFRLLNKKVGRRFSRNNQDIRFTNHTMRGRHWRALHRCRYANFLFYGCSVTETRLLLFSAINSIFMLDVKVVHKSLLPSHNVGGT